MAKRRDSVESNSLDVAGTPPETGYATCDTASCELYIDKIDSISQALTDRFDIECGLARNDPKSPYTTQEKIALNQEYSTWLTAHRIPWTLSRVKLREDCDSTFSTPCKNALAVAFDHEKSVLAFAGKLEQMTGKKTGITPISNQGGNSLPNNGGGKGNGFNLNIGGPSTVAVVLAAAVAAYILSRK